MDFDSVHNYHEEAVFRAVIEHAANHPAVAASPELLADVACIALNRLPPRYIRNRVDTTFFMDEKERSRNELALRKAVEFAFTFVQSRVLSHARG